MGGFGGKACIKDRQIHTGTRRYGENRGFMHGDNQQCKRGGGRGGVEDAGGTDQLVQPTCKLIMTAAESQEDTHSLPRGQKTAAICHEADI